MNIRKKAAKSVVSILYLSLLFKGTVNIVIYRVFLNHTTVMKLKINVNLINVITEYIKTFSLPL